MNPRPPANHRAIIIDRARAPPRGARHHAYIYIYIYVYTHKLATRTLHVPSSTVRSSPPTNIFDPADASVVESPIGVGGVGECGLGVVVVARVCVCVCVCVSDRPHPDTTPHHLIRPCPYATYCGPMRAMCDVRCVAWAMCGVAGCATVS